MWQRSRKRALDMEAGLVDWGMPTAAPGPLTPAQRRARRQRAARVARRLGFVGTIEYRHVYSQTGGAQYGRGNTAQEDLLTVWVAGRVSAASEEILASLLGAMLCPTQTDRDALVAKALLELLDHGEVADVAIRRLQELWNLLEALL